MQHLTIGDELLLDGIAHTVVGLSEGSLILRSITGAEHRHNSIDLFASHDVEVRESPILGAASHRHPHPRPEVQAGVGAALQHWPASA
ncbi:hypothetical protein [Kineococcus arenarius]|uniref:hypothetical protein n=1 Tax=unclassified Kineococcus TaxID=2621656 RepID=UPI003D7C9B92